MSKRDPILALFNIYPEERYMAFLLFLFAFFSGLSVVFTGTTAGAVFLSQYGAEVLPFMYIIVGLVIVVISGISSFLEAKAPYKPYLILIILLTSGSTLLFWLFLPGSSRWLAALLFIWKNVMLFLLSVALWGMANRALTIRQGKRLFGFIGAGEVLAEILGGFAGTLVLQFISNRHLLLLSTISVFIMVLLALMVVTRLADGERTPKREASSKKGWKKRINYLVLLFLVTTIIWLGFFFFENTFYLEAKNRFPEENALAAFFSLFFGITGTITFISKLFISDKLVIRFGVKLSLLILPIIAILFFAGYGILNIRFPDSGYVFIVTMLSMLMYKFLRSSVHKSAVMVLFQPVPKESRHQFLLVSERFGGVLAGSFLFLMVNVLRVNYPVISLLIIPIFLLFIILIPVLQRIYKRSLKSALESRQLSGMELSIGDTGSLSILEQALQSESVGQVIYAMSILEKTDRKNIATHLGNLLSHSDEIVRKKVLYRIGKLGLESLLPAVQKLLTRERAKKVRGLVLRTLMAIGKNGMIKTVSPFIHNRSLPVKRGALVGLLRYGGIEGVLIGGTELLRLVSSSRAEDRITSARIIENVGIKEFYTPLEPLLLDADFSVRKAALRASRKTCNPVLYPKVVESLSVPATHLDAVEVLIRAGEDVLPELKNAYYKPGQIMEVQLAVITIAGKIGGERAVKFLADCLEELIVQNSKPVLNEVLKSLKNCRYNVPVNSAFTVKTLMEQEAEDVAFIIAVRHRIGESLLRRALEGELASSKKRILTLLSFLSRSESDTFILASQNLENKSEELRDYALELIDFVLPPALKSTIMPILENRANPVSQQDEEGNLSTFEEMPLPLLIREFLRTSDKWQTYWLTACALAMLSEKDFLSMEGEILELVNRYSMTPLKESALSLAAAYSDQLVEKWCKAVGCRMFVKEDLPILIRLELLTQSKLFGNISFRILFDLASGCHSSKFEKGAQIIKKGDVGKSMYIIAGGKVNVDSGGGRIHQLVTGDVLGELSLLDAEPRSADVFAEEACALLEIQQEIFYNIIRQEQEVALAITDVLVGRINDRLKWMRPEKQKFKISYKNLKMDSDASSISLLPVEKVLLLKTISYFSNLSHSVLNTLSTYLQDAIFQQGEELMKKGEPVAALYIVISGKILEHSYYPGLQKGERRSLFGDIEFFSHGTYISTVTAMEPVFAYRILREDFETLIALFPEICSQAIKVLSHKVRNV